MPTKRGLSQKNVYFDLDDDAQRKLLEDVLAASKEHGGFSAYVRFLAREEFKRQAEAAVLKSRRRDAGAVRRVIAAMPADMTPEQILAEFKVGRVPPVVSAIGGRKLTRKDR